MGKEIEATPLPFPSQPLSRLARCSTQAESSLHGGSVLLRFRQPQGGLLQRQRYREGLGWRERRVHGGEIGRDLKEPPLVIPTFSLTRFARRFARRSRSLSLKVPLWTKVLDTATTFRTPGQSES